MIIPSVPRGGFSDQKFREGESPRRESVGFCRGLKDEGYGGYFAQARFGPERGLAAISRLYRSLTIQGGTIMGCRIIFTVGFRSSPDPGLAP
jgi:hypothetical protein